MIFRKLVVCLLCLLFVGSLNANVKDTNISDLDKTSKDIKDEYRLYYVKRGDTLYSLLDEIFSPAEILEISKKINNKLNSFILKEGQKIKFYKDKVVINAAVDKDLTILKNNEGFNIVVTKYDIQTINYVVNGTINESLFKSVNSIGEDDRLAIMLADILQWEVDFFKDIRKGDHYKLVVEKKFCRSKFIGYGKILALDFINRDELIRAYYYEDDKISGYFKYDGTSLKRGFLRAPLKYSRISSKFSYSRLHPIFHKPMPHLGIDYAAPTGTPVYSTADGKVIVRGYKRGNGNYIKISHNNGFYTYYMHLSGFAKGIYVGSRVRQGQVIGYVGATGYATGPHLDYRIKRYSKFLNPLKFKAPTKKMPTSKIPLFRENIAKFKNLLDNTYYRYA
ncbi:MAG: peptidoglycan DD-metalloendopeptidase family protein, partial [Deferribacterota bacterium]|nr:peptidoglycan DD-metalloendopeptidase family protein [Deferribacterota bacterium]